MGNKIFTVSRYMSVSPITINEKASVREVIQVMLKDKTNGLVVVDDRNKVVGILSSWDIIHYIVPDYLENDSGLASFEADSVFEERIKLLATHPLKKFMEKDCKTIRADHSLIEAATLLSEFHTRQLPVISAEGLLVGHINRSDIKRALYDALSD